MYILVILFFSKRMAPLGALLSLAAILGVAGATKVQRVASRPCLRSGYSDTIYEHSAQDFWGSRDIQLSEYRGKVSVMQLITCLN